jgi:flagellar biosynthesis protein
MDRDSAENRRAVVLRYAPQTAGAAHLVRSYEAEKLIEIARQQNIPICENKHLLQILSRLDLDQDVPLEVYRAVGEILAFVYRVSNSKQEPLEP